MSELKDYSILDIEAIDDERFKKESAPGKWVPESRVYLKSEADAVIAKLKNEIEEQKRLRDMALASVPNVLKVMKIIQHQKYKRCLAMAEMCKARYDEEDACINGCGASWEYISLKMKYWERWSWYWEALAEEPTWAKFLQLIHKEAK